MHEQFGPLILLGTSAGSKKEIGLIKTMSQFHKKYQKDC